VEAFRNREKKYIFFLRESYAAFARIARRVQERDFIQAESYVARDRIARAMAAECYGLAEKLRHQGEGKLSLQYMKLAAKLLGLSLRPKKLSDLDEIKRALAKLKAEKDGS
jgi:hypothetical protein